ncbi:protein of unassigned function [Methylobacterium oryzae CBMB20]|uniref:Protein of unassigned function n=2 Tax=Methylobacterium oryzae TaxID=334852 RepID=A0A089NS67_9HYPH|nr:protein of unassigned function [Methylobacterium oryzae CBMB20]
MPVEAQGKILTVQDNFSVEIGQEEIFGLIDPDGKPLIGTKKSLQPHVELWIGQVDDIVCQLNMSLFCDFEKVSVAFGKKVFANKVAELRDRDAAARWFASAFTCAPMCREVSKLLYARSRNHEDDVIGDLSPTVQTGRKSVRIDFPDEILDLDEQSQSGLKKRFAEIVSFSELSTGYSFYFGPFARFKSRGRPDYPEDAHSVDSGIEIHKHKRQERRLAELLRVYLHDEWEGSKLLSSYTDSSKYVNKSLSILSNLSESKGRDHSGRVALVASFIPNLTRAAFPQQRGILLIELARVLGKHTIIAAAILHQASKSNQREVIAARSAIQDFISNS